jgi:hypothetical protein
LRYGAVAAILGSGALPGLEGAVEGLVIIIAELLAALLAPLFALVGGLAALLLELLAALVGALLSGRRRRREAAAPVPAPVLVTWRIPRVWLHVATGLCALLLAGVFVVNTLFLAPSLRWMLARVEERTGYAVAFETAKGNLFSGRLALSGVSVSRPPGRGLALDVAAETVAFDVRMISLLGSEVALESLELAGVTGRLEPPSRSDGAAAPGAAPRPRRAFAVARAALADIDVEVAGPGRPPLQLEISKATAEPFRSRSALFDLFFRSTLDARLDGTPLRVETAVISEKGRRTLWAFEEVPVATLASLTARAPISWLSGGAVSANVTDEWDLANAERRIDMDWRLVFDGVEAAPPAGAGAAETLLARGLGAALARTGGSADYAFTLSLDRERLEAAGSDDLGALWEALRDGVAAVLAERTGETARGAAGRVEAARERFLNLLRPSEDEPEPGGPAAPEAEP